MCCSPSTHYEKCLSVGMTLQGKHLINQFMHFPRQFLTAVDFECNILNYNSLCIFTLAFCQGFSEWFIQNFTTQDLVDKGIKNQPTSAVCTHFLFQCCLENTCCLSNKYTGRKISMVPTHSGSRFPSYFLNDSVNILFCDYYCKIYSICSLRIS